MQYTKPNKIPLKVRDTTWTITQQFTVNMRWNIGGVQLTERKETTTVSDVTDNNQSRQDRHQACPLHQGQSRDLGTRRHQKRQRLQ